MLSGFATEQTLPVPLSEEERAWVAQHSPIRVGVTPEWSPFSYFTADDKPNGIDVDVLRIISERTGLKFEIIPATPWAKMVQMIEERQLDVTTSTVETMERQKIFLFTRPYADAPIVIVAREGDHRFAHLSQLRRARLAQPRRHVVTLSLIERLPDLQVERFPNQRECFEQVAQGKADATVINLFAAAQYLNEHPEARLGISGVVTEFDWPLRLAVRRDYGVLAGILDRGLASISQTEMDEIIDRHLMFALLAERRAALLRRRILAALVVSVGLAGWLYLWNCLIRREVRARRATEAELREMNRSLEVFAHAVSHDLKAPLRAIRGFSEALREDYRAKFDDVGRDYLERIIGSVKRMDALVTDVLAYTRATRGELSAQAVALEPLIRQLVGEFPPEQRDYFRIAPGMPDVYANAALLGQCIANLLSNAVKFVPSGRIPDVAIRAERMGSMVKLTVEDNGIGIAPEDQPRIFEVFQRVHSGEYAGTGIGLAIVAKGVARMRGRVGVESVVGQGSRFWIELPAASVAVEHEPAA